MKGKQQGSSSALSFTQIVAGLSHHLNNPLAAILGYAELLLRRDLDASSKGMVELIFQQASHCKHALQSLHGMTSQPTQEFQAVDLRSLVQECMATKKGEFQAGDVNVHLDFPNDGLVTQADPVALEQVVVQLLDNALQALEGDSKDKTLSISGFHSDGWTAVQVKDTGRGIRTDVLPQIFEPFYTTKSREKNPGLGLTICHSILDEHQGSIRVESTEGEGTSVTLLLPDKVKPADAVGGAAPILAGRKILVAEDEPALAKLLGSFLTPLKAEVVHVNNGLEALAIAQQSQWDLIISDIQMPGISGIELYHRLASSDSALANRMILITGAARSQPERLLQDAKAQLLYKPFSRSELMEVISRVIAERPPEG